MCSATSSAITAATVPKNQIIGFSSRACRNWTRHTCVNHRTVKIRTVKNVIHALFSRKDTKPNVKNIRHHVQYHLHWIELRSLRLDKSRVVAKDLPIPHKPDSYALLPPFCSRRGDIRHQR